MGEHIEFHHLVVEYHNTKDGILCVPHITISTQYENINTGIYTSTHGIGKLNI